MNDIKAKLDRYEAWAEREPINKQQEIIAGLSIFFRPFLREYLARNGLSSIANYRNLSEEIVRFAENPDFFNAAIANRYLESFQKIMPDTDFDETHWMDIFSQDSLLVFKSMLEYFTGIDDDFAKLFSEAVGTFLKFCDLIASDFLEREENIDLESLFVIPETRPISELVQTVSELAETIYR